MNNLQFNKYLSRFNSLQFICLIFIIILSQILPFSSKINESFAFDQKQIESTAAVKNESEINKAIVEIQKSYLDGIAKSYFIEISQSTKRIELIVLILSFLITVLTILIAFLSYTSSKRVEDIISKNEHYLKEHEKNLDAKITKQVAYFFSINLKNKLDLIDKKIIEEIENAKTIFKNEIEKDFAEPIEKRYLLAEYVISSVLDNLSPLILKSLNDGRYDDYMDIMKNFSKIQVGLRQILSADPYDIFTGLGTLFDVIHFLPKYKLWSLICLLNNQKRLNLENISAAKRIGRAVGLNFT